MKKVVREEESATKYVAESSVGKLTHKTVVTITEYIWKFDVSYSLKVQAGTDAAGALLLAANEISCNITTSSDSSPRAAKRVCDPRSANVSWFAARMGSGASPADATFAIDRSKRSCHTPSNNEDVAAAVACLNELRGFAISMVAYFVQELCSLFSTTTLPMYSLNLSNMFVPVLPVLDTTGGQYAIDMPKGSVLSEADQRLIVQHYRKDLLEATLPSLRRSFPEASGLMTQREATLSGVFNHMSALLLRHAHCVDYIEHLLLQQLIASVGKVLTARDFDKYMKFHARQIFAPLYAPKVRVRNDLSRLKLID